MKKLIVLMALVLVIAALVGCSNDQVVFTQQHVQCTSTLNNGLINVSCPNGMNYSFPAPKDGVDGLNGVNGINGTNGLDAQGIRIIDPCGDYAGGPDEVLLVFPNGDVLAWYQGLGLSLMLVGTTYQTTDGQHCIFKVDEDGTVVF